MSALRAITTGVLVAIAAFFMLVWVPDWLLQNLSGDRSSRVFFATTEFVVALLVLLWGMRRLQRRGVL